MVARLPFDTLASRRKPLAKCVLARRTFHEWRMRFFVFGVPPTPLVRELPGFLITACLTFPFTSSAIVAFNPRAPSMAWEYLNHPAMATTPPLDAGRIWGYPWIPFVSGSLTGLANTPFPVMPNLMAPKIPATTTHPIRPCHRPTVPCQIAEGINSELFAKCWNGDIFEQYAPDIRGRPWNN
jgi:hypothetical protein